VKSLPVLNACADFHCPFKRRHESGSVDVQLAQVFCQRSLLDSLTAVGLMEGKRVFISSLEVPRRPAGGTEFTVLERG